MRPHPEQDTIKRVAASLPENEAEMMAQARAALERYDAAIVAGDREASERAGDEYDTIIWKMNDETFTGCLAGRDSPGNRVAAY